MQHIVVGFNVYTGQVTLRKQADPVGGGDSLPHLQQRAALAVANGRVYVAFGGLAGDCGTYHGWVVGVDETGSRPDIQFDVTPGFTGGAIWNGGGGPSVDGQGNLYVTTGNQNSGSAAQTPYAEAVVKLSPDLSVLAHFQDTHSSGDADLGTGDALLLPDGELWTAGKTDIGYLLRQSDLSQAHAIAGTVCGSDPDGGSTYDAADNSLYVPCRNGGLQQVSLATDATGWRTGSVNSSPVLVDGGLWAARAGGNLIQELNPTNGAVLQQIHTTHSLPTFATPSAADGLLLIGTSAGIQAFDGPGGPPAPAPPPPAPVPPSPASSAGYRLVAGSTGGTHLNAPVVAMAADAATGGYRLFASDGGVFSFKAPFFGSTGGIRLARPVVGAAGAAAGGYWMVASDGGVFNFGPGAVFHGSTGGRSASPVVGMATASRTGGYWLTETAGQVVAFDAPFEGSLAGTPLTRPVVAITGF